MCAEELLRRFVVERFVLDLEVMRREFAVGPTDVDVIVIGTVLAEVDVGPEIVVPDLEIGGFVRVIESVVSKSSVVVVGRYSALIA